MSPERWYPTAFALFAGLAQALWGPPGLLASDNMLMFVGGLGAIAIGFTGTALTVLIAIEERPVIRWLRSARLPQSQEDGYSLLLRYMMAALRWWFAALVLTGAGFIVERILVRPQVYTATAVLLSAVSVGGLCAWYRVMRLTVQLLRSDRRLSEQKSHPEEQSVPQRRSATG